MITRTWYDPCPRCHREVTGVDYEPEYVVDNPTSVLAIPNPSCPHLADPEADCTCTVLINPAPDPWQDTYLAVGAWFTMHPCGDVIHSGPAMAGWKMYQQTSPEPGSLGELIADWTADEQQTTEGGPR
jgi:hypothetical protein